MERRKKLEGVRKKEGDTKNEGVKRRLPVEIRLQTIRRLPSKINRSNRMKAVSMIIEYSLLFLFGIIIFISSVNVFGNYDAYFSSVSVNDHLNEISEYMSSNIIKLAETGSGEESSIILKIPKKIGNENYMIELSSGGLNITSINTRVSKSSSLYNLNSTYILSGKAVSTAGSVIIYKTGNQIIIS
jgi:hypothetical protein